MALATVQRPIRRLRRRLRSLSASPSIQAVHALRTSMRRVEAIVAALKMERKKPVRRLIKAIKAVRKAAGAVRDIDVLAGIALTLARNCRDDSLLRLLWRLHGLRIASARRLVDAVRAHRKDACRCLKRFSRQIEKWFTVENPAKTAETDWVALHRQAAARLLKHLEIWPELDARNLHPFRIKVNELRYVLQLTKDTDSALMLALDRARNQIGDWHDWRQLARIAEKTLDPATDRAVLGRIAETEDRKFNLALRAAKMICAFHCAVASVVRHTDGH